MLGSKNVWVGIFAEIIMSGSISSELLSIYHNQLHSVLFLLMVLGFVRIAYAHTVMLGEIIVLKLAA